jgi:hypothetical protein
LHLPEFILGLSDAILLVVGDVFVYCEAPMVTSSISRNPSAQSFRDAHKEG